MHPSIFEYLQPTDKQISDMARVRQAFSDLYPFLNLYLPDGPDKDRAVQYLRTAAMWANVAITREADGSPRE